MSMLPIAMTINVSCRHWAEARSLKVLPAFSPALGMTHLQRREQEVAGEGGGAGCVGDSRTDLRPSAGLGLDRSQNCHRLTNTVTPSQAPPLLK